MLHTCTFGEGLVDASDDADFQEKLVSVQESWQSLEQTSSCDLEKHIDFFTDRKVSILCDTMSRSLGIECGIGNPPKYIHYHDE